MRPQACKAGIVGSLTRNHCRDIEEFEAQLKAVAERVARFRDLNPERKIGPLAVNISTHIAGDDMRAHLALCRRYGARIVITSVGDPTSTVPLVHEAGLLHFHDATSLRFAEKAIAAGVDGIVAIGAGGGGHSGTISHLAFIPQVRAMFDGTVVLAGAVSNGATIRAAEILGADLAYLGTRFIATREASAPDEYKAMLVEGTAADVIYTDAVNGMPAMWLKASLRANRPRSRQVAKALEARHRSSAGRREAVEDRLERRPGHRPDPRHSVRRRTRAPAAGRIRRGLLHARHGQGSNGGNAERGPRSMSQRVTRHDAGGVCTLTLNRPDKLNALDTTAFEELDAHLAALEQDRGNCRLRRAARRRQGLLRGRRSQGARRHDEAPPPPTFKPGVIERLALLKQPVIAAVHGVCFTGGLELALACDFIVADATARFADTHGKWGLVAAWGMSQRLPRRIGLAAAKRMMMTARVVEAAEAKELGLVDLLAPEGQLDEVLKQFVGRAAREQLVHQLRHQAAA